MLTAEEVITRLGMQPLEAEGGFFVEMYRSHLKVRVAEPEMERIASTAIYYLLTEKTCSRLHRLRSDEVWHFYLGDPVDQVLLEVAGRGRVVTLGHDLVAGQVCQTLVPQGVWQGAQLRPGGRWALMGCTVAPGFEFADFELGDRARLCAEYPAFRTWIEALT